MGGSTITYPKEPLPPDYFTADRSSVLLGVAILFIILETLAFSLRVISRKIKGTKLGWDDGFMIPALLCNYGLCTLCLLGLHYGIGRHTLAIVKDDPKWPQDAHKKVAAIALIPLPITFLFAVTFSKLAILNLFLQVFKFGISRVIIQLVGAVVIVQCIVCTVVTIMQCNPVSLTWSSTVRETCIDVTEFFRLSSIPNVITDFIMLVMPLPEVWRLSASLRVKAGITITLLTASMGIISSVLRFAELIKTDTFEDPLWHDVNLLAYSIAEPGTLFIAACLVTYRPLLKRFSGKHYFSSLVSKFRTNRSGEANSAGDVLESGGAKLEQVPIEAKTPKRGFNSILLSAVSRDIKTAGDSALHLSKTNESADAPSRASNNDNGSIV